MRPGLISVAMLGVMQVAVPAAVAAPAGRPVADGEGADGGRGSALARAGASSFLTAPEARQSPLVAVGEGGEGGMGKRKGKGWRRHGEGYGYREPYRYRAEPYGWAPPPRGYYAPPPPRYGWYPEPPPRAYPPRPPSAGVWVDPGF